jgi:mannonate dehydratase
VEEVAKRKQLIVEAGLTWSVVESVNVHESIKTGEPERDRYIALYIQSLQNLAAQGLKVVCYNFMPVLDWTRTHLDYRLPNNASALKYDAVALTAFDLYILQRLKAFATTSKEEQDPARQYLDQCTVNEIELLTNTIMAGLPGTDDVFTVDEFKLHLQRYAGIDAQQLKKFSLLFKSHHTHCRATRH